MTAAYYELIVKGDRKFLQGFIRGIDLDRSGAAGFWFCEERLVQREHLKLLRPRGHYVHLVCTPAARRRVLPAFERAADFGIEVVSDKKIVRAFCEFEFDTFSRDVARSLKKFFKTLPAGLELLAYRPKETVDKKARGVELYSPVHEYRFEGKGRIEGDFASLLDVRRRLEAIEFANVGRIRILT